MNIQLSISMLVSDRSETLEKCLNSLTGFLRELPSELIIVFTGEKQETLETIKRYTDHIIPFKWCNDFAAARNSGLREARGEWFMYVDDDEWFEDPEEIIAFFKTGECQHYSAGSYPVRNYANLEGIDYSDAYVKRLYRNDGSLRFVSAIHEYIPNNLSPVKSFSAYAHHYGYAKSDKKQSAKYDRNVPLLLKEIEKNPTLSKNYMQLAQEYKAAGKFREAAETCRAGLSLVTDDSICFAVNQWMVAYLPLFFQVQGDNRLALQEAEEWAHSKKVTDLTKAYLYVTIVKLCRKLNDTEKGMSYIRPFHKLWNLLHQHEEKTHQQDSGEINLGTIDTMVYSVHVNALNWAVQEKNFSFVSEILQWIPWEDEKVMRSYYLLLEQWKKDYSSENEEILKCYSELPYDTPYLLLQKALYAETQKKIPLLKKLLGQCHLQVSKELLCINPQIIELAIKHDIAISPFLAETTLEYWGAYVLQVVKETNSQDMPELLEKAKHVLKNYPMHASLFEQCFMEKQMLMGWLDGKELISIAERYCGIVIDYYKELYIGKFFAEKLYEMLPAKCAFALYLQEAFSEMKQQPELYIKNLRKALHAYPEFSAIITKLLKYFEIQQKKSTNNGIEFAELGRKIKEEVKTLITTGRYVEANIILMKLLAMMPDDLELIRLKQQLLTQRR